MKAKKFTLQMPLNQRAYHGEYWKTCVKHLRGDEEVRGTADDIVSRFYGPGSADRFAWRERVPTP